MVPAALVERLHRKADAARWGVSVARFAAALEASPGNPESLHLADLALACACADGHEAAWEHFIREQRPVLYRAADAIDPAGGARDLADAIYADLFSKSLFRYFHGRSSLSTWLRAVLAQRHVDRLRSGRRTDPLPEDESPAALAAPGAVPAPGHQQRVTRMQRALADAVAGLTPEDRLRMACYYVQDLTLAQTGKMLGEHEATVSRQLARTRRDIRAEVERRLKSDGLTEAEISECFTTIAEDAGSLDLGALLAPGKKTRPDRSNST
jgi:RNA polymerase sigma factor (sigma-70 family)